MNSNTLIYDPDHVSCNRCPRCEASAVWAADRLSTGCKRRCRVGSICVYIRFILSFILHVNVSQVLCFIRSNKSAGNWHTHTHRAAVVHYYQLDSRYWILWTQSFIAIHTQERSTSLRPVYSGHTKHICILPDFTNAAPLLLICGILRRNRSAGLGELDFPRVMSTCGGRAFANAGFTSWNSLRDNLKNVNLSLQTKKC